MFFRLPKVQSALFWIGFVRKIKVESVKAATDLGCNSIRRKLVSVKQRGAAITMVNANSVGVLLLLQHLSYNNPKTFCL